MKEERSKEKPVFGRKGRDRTRSRCVGPNRTGKGW